MPWYRMAIFPLKNLTIYSWKEKVMGGRCSGAGVLPSKSEAAEWWRLEAEASFVGWTVPVRMNAS